MYYCAYGDAGYDASAIIATPNARAGMYFNEAQREFKTGICALSGLL